MGCRQVAIVPMEEHRLAMRCVQRTRACGRFSIADGREDDDAKLERTYQRLEKRKGNK